MQEPMSKKLQLALIKANNNLGIAEFNNGSYDNARAYFLNSKKINKADSLANFFFYYAKEIYYTIKVTKIAFGLQFKNTTKPLNLTL